MVDEFFDNDNKCIFVSGILIDGHAASQDIPRG